MDIKQTVLRILFWSLFILAIIFFIWHFSGKSPTFEQGVLLLILSLVIQIGYSVNSHKHIIKDLKHKMNALENRVNKIENK